MRWALNSRSTSHGGLQNIGKSWADMMGFPFPCYQRVFGEIMWNPSRHGMSHILSLWLSQVLDTWMCILRFVHGSYGPYGNGVPQDRWLKARRTSQLSKKLTSSHKKKTEVEHGRTHMQLGLTPLMLGFYHGFLATSHIHPITYYAGFSHRKPGCSHSFHIIHIPYPSAHASKWLIPIFQ